MSGRFSDFDQAPANRWVEALRTGGAIIIDAWLDTSESAARSAPGAVVIAYMTCEYSRYRREADNRTKQPSDAHKAKVASRVPCRDGDPLVKHNGGSCATA